jgi:hypothetical protein
MPYFVGAGNPGDANYVPGLLPKAQEIFSKDYASTYGNTLNAAGLSGAGRVADLSPMQQQIGTSLAGMTTPDQFNQAQGYGTAAGDAFSNLTGTQALSVQNSPLYQYQMQGAGNVGIGSITNPGALNAYMSPYQQNVTDLQKQSAVRDWQKNIPGMQAQASQAGAFGGSRQAIQQSEAQRSLGSQLNNIQATGLQNAFQNAQQQFNSENQLGLQAKLANQNTQQSTQQQNLQAMLGVQQLGSGQNLQAQTANQAAALQAAQQRAAAAQGLSSLSSNLTSQGVAQQAANLDLIKTQGAYGDLQRGVAQQKVDAQYADLMKSLGYPTEQLNNMSSILRGVPLGDTSSTSTTTTPPPSFASQLAGMGLTGLSLYSMLKGP